METIRRVNRVRVPVRVGVAAAHVRERPFLDIPDDEEARALRDIATRLDESLVLAVAYEPPESLADELFGLDDAALRRVVALTLARVGIRRPVELSVLITDDEGLRTLNREYRGRDEATDVLSFPLLDAPLVDAPAEELWQPLAEDESTGWPDGDVTPSTIPAYDSEDGEIGDAAEGAAEDAEWDSEIEFPAPQGETLHLGDIALSRDAIMRQAAQAGHSPAWECAYLLAHGVLHLVGYDDHTEAGYRAMVAHQERALALAGIAR